jgi:hypothetical protein
MTVGQKRRYSPLMTHNHVSAGDAKLTAPTATPKGHTAVLREFREIR